MTEGFFERRKHEKWKEKKLKSFRGKNTIRPFKDSEENHAKLFMLPHWRQRWPEAFCFQAQHEHIHVSQGIPVSQTQCLCNLKWEWTDWNLVIQLCLKPAPTWNIHYRMRTTSFIQFTDLFIAYGRTLLSFSAVYLHCCDTMNIPLEGPIKPFFPLFYISTLLTEFHTNI